MVSPALRARAGPVALPGGCQRVARIRAPPRPPPRFGRSPPPTPSRPQTKSPTEAHEVAAELTKALSGKDAAQKEAALIAIKSIVSAKTVPFFLHYLAAVLELVADNKLSALAREASNQIVKSADPLAVKLILPQIAASLTIKSKWQTKVAALQCLKDMTTTSTTQVSSQAGRAGAEARSGRAEREAARGSPGGPARNGLPRPVAPFLTRFRTHTPRHHPRAGGPVAHGDHPAADRCVPRAGSAAAAHAAPATRPGVGAREERVGGACQLAPTPGGGGRDAAAAGCCHLSGGNPAAGSAARALPCLSGGAAHAAALPSGGSTYPGRGCTHAHPARPPH